MNAVLSRPRPGSSIDKAMRAIEAEGTPMNRASVAALIEHDEDEVDGLLRYGVRMGMLVRTETDGEVRYSLGDGVPLPEPEPAPVPAPSPRLAAVRSSRMDAPEPMGLRPTACTLDENRSVSRMLWPGGYTTKTGGQAERLLQHLQAKAPAGGEFWIVSRDLADATNIPRGSVQPLLISAMRHNAVRMRHVDGGRVAYQMGDGIGATPVHDVAPAAAPAPAVERVASSSPAAAVQKAPAAMPDDAQAQLAENTAVLLAHYDLEIARLEHNLRLLRRRREAMAADASELGAKAA